jgi:hypothetical protein
MKNQSPTPFVSDEIDDTVAVAGGTTESDRSGGDAANINYVMHEHVQGVSLD